MAMSSSEVANSSSKDGPRSGSGSGKTAEALVGKLDPSVDPMIIKSTLKNIREKIHNSKQFYKEFLVKFYSSDGGSKLLEILKEKTEDEELVDLSVSVLATCCLDQNNAEQVKDCSGIAIIASVLRHYSKSSISITNRCARALANLARSTDIEDNLEEDVIPILVHALDVTEDSGCCHSLLRVLKIFASSKDKTILWNIIGCGGLRVVCEKSKSKDSKLVLLAVETAVALTAPFDKRKLRCALTLPAAAANPVLENDSLSNLFDLLSHHKPEVQYNSWECIGNLMSSDIGRAALGNAGFVKFYLATAKNEDVKKSVRERCAQYLCLCCQESVNRAKMSELDGLQFLIDLISGDLDSLPDVPSALVIAAIAEFRYDASSMEQFANNNLVKVLIQHLQKKVKEQRKQPDEDEEKASGMEEDESMERGARKRKRKRQRGSSKRTRLDSNLEDSDTHTGIEVDKHLLNPTITIPQPLTKDCDDGLSPQYSAHWYPESPRLSPPPHNLAGSSPSKYYTSGLSPPRAHFSTSPPHIHQPTYQFPSSMMSPPKSDSASPGSSPSYFYDPSSPQKFFGYSEEIFSPVVSEESDIDTNSNTSSESCNSTDGEDKGVNLAGGRTRSLMQHDDGQQSGMLAQATRKLTLSKCDTASLSKPEDTLSIHVVSGSIMEVEKTGSEAEVKGTTKAGNQSLSPSPNPSTSCSRRPKNPVPRAMRIPSSPRTSFSFDLPDGERTPTKQPETRPKRRQEEENILLILQEVILLHQIPSIMFITKECSVETLLHFATVDTVARDRANVLLKDLLSSRLFYDKLMSHNIPFLVYRSLTAKERQCRRIENQQPTSRIAGSIGDKDKILHERQRSRIQEYLDILRDIGESSFGWKEMEHVLREQQKERKLSAALSLPYLFRCGRTLRGLIVDCEIIQQMLSHFQDQSSKDLLRKACHSLSHTSRSLLPQWEEFRDRHFSLDAQSAPDEVMMTQSKEGDMASSNDCDECLYMAQEHLSDLDLVCKNGETLKASQQVLSARSEYFACLLTGQFLEAGQKSVKLGSFQIKSLTCVIHSLYDCHPQQCRTLRNLIGETMESLLDIIAVAKFCMTSKNSLHQSGSSDYCLLEQWVTHIILHRNLVDRTVCRLINFAALHNCQKLLECCLLFVLCRRSRLRKHLRVLLASQLGDQIKHCIVELFQNP
nr:uncharacterized protein LOC129254907 [Lytechinus pictus]